MFRKYQINLPKFKDKFIVDKLSKISVKNETRAVM